MKKLIYKLKDSVYFKTSKRSRFKLFLSTLILVYLVKTIESYFDLIVIFLSIISYMLSLEFYEEIDVSFKEKEIRKHDPEFLNDLNNLIDGHFGKEVNE